MEAEKMGKRNCGQALVALLKSYGIDMAFGIPGVHTIELYRGFDQQGITHILPRHEQGAGFMADGYARASGRPAACFLISGPGLTNASTAIAQAYADSQPMVVIATTLNRCELGKGWAPFHELRNQRLIAEQFCSYAGQVLAPGDIPDIVAQAIATMQGGRPRPVYIEIPRDILAEPATGDWIARPPVLRPAPVAAQVDEAAAMLAAATRPVLLIGAGAVEASAALRSITERTKAAVITSFCGKGIVAESHPCVIGAALAMAQARDLVADADVVMAIGTELSTTDSYEATLRFEGKLIRVDIDPRKTSDRYRADLPIVGDAALFATALDQRLAGLAVAGASADWTAQIADVKQAFVRFGSARSTEHPKVLDAIRRALPDDAIVVSDMTQIAYSGNHCFRVEQPRTWLHPAAYATLGYALPAALGAKLAMPDRAVVSISGDAGFLFTCQEMATAAERNIPIVQVVWRNDSLGEIDKAMTNAQISPVEVDLKNPDFVALARSFHWVGEHAHSLKDLTEKIERAIASAMPTLIEVREGAGDWAS
jgi:5-guanidino-2-oxopentanoate decarboxylase